MEEEQNNLNETDLNDVKYPSAELFKDACFGDYESVLGVYDKIYEKVNIALAFCGIVILIIVSQFDVTILMRLFQVKVTSEFMQLLLYFLFSLASVVLIVWSIVELLLLLRSREMTVFDSNAIKNEKLYFMKPDEASLWLIEKYLNAIEDIRRINADKNRIYNRSITKAMIAVLFYVAAAVLGKGL